MNRIALFSALAAASLLGASSALACDGAKSETTAKVEAPADAQLVTLVINDASCGSCVVPIREQITALNGVLEVKGSDENFQWVHVTMTRGSVSTDQLIAAVKKAGYTATVKVDDAQKS
jgi:copper chaperone CopZ